MSGGTETVRDLYPALRPSPASQSFRVLTPSSSLNTGTRNLEYLLPQIQEARPPALPVQDSGIRTLSPFFHQTQPPHPRLTCRRLL